MCLFFPIPNLKSACTLNLWPLCPCDKAFETEGERRILSCLASTSCIMMARACDGEICSSNNKAERDQKNLEETFDRMSPSYRHRHISFCLFLKLLLNSTPTRKQGEVYELVWDSWIHIQSIKCFNLSSLSVSVSPSFSSIPIKIVCSADNSFAWDYISF